MELQRDGVLRELLETAEALPEVEVREVIDFAGALRRKHPVEPAPGSAEALLRHVGSLSFEDGELDQLLGDIARQRESELDTDG